MTKSHRRLPSHQRYDHYVCRNGNQPGAPKRCAKDTRNAQARAAAAHSDALSADAEAELRFHTALAERDTLPSGAPADVITAADKAVLVAQQTHEKASARSARAADRLRNASRAYRSTPAGAAEIVAQIHMSRARHEHPVTIKHMQQDLDTAIDDYNRMAAERNMRWGSTDQPMHVMPCDDVDGNSHPPRLAGVAIPDDEPNGDRPVSWSVTVHNPDLDVQITTKVESRTTPTPAATLDALSGSCGKLTWDQHGGSYDRFVEDSGKTDIARHRRDWRNVERRVEALETLFPPDRYSDQLDGHGYPLRQHTGADYVAAAGPG